MWNFQDFPKVLWSIMSVSVIHSNSPRRKPAQTDFVWSTLDGVFNNRGKVWNFFSRHLFTTSPSSLKWLVSYSWQIVIKHWTRRLRKKVSVILPCCWCCVLLSKRLFRSQSKCLFDICLSNLSIIVSFVSFSVSRKRFQLQPQPYAAIKIMLCAINFP